MSSGSLGRASVDLDANLQPLSEGLRRSKSEVQAWISNIERNKPEIEIDTTTAQRDLHRIAAEVGKVGDKAEPIDVRVQVANALSALDKVGDEAARISASNPIITVRTNASGAVTSMRVTTKAAEDMGRSATVAAKQVETAADKAQSSMQRLGGAGKSALGGLAGAISPIPLGLAGIGVGVAAVGVGVTKFGVDAVQAFASFESGMAQVFTLLPNQSAAAMTAMGDQVLALSQKYGVMTSDVVPALYEAISSGVPQEDVFSFLGTAIEASIAGGTDVMVMVDGLTSVINGYGMAATDAGRISDVFFAAVNVGKLSADQLASTLYDVVPIAASVGVSFEEVAAAIAAMTAQGVPATVATTQLRSLFNELSKDGTKLSSAFEQVVGVGFREFVAAGGTVEEALTLIQSHASETGVSVNDLASSTEAGAAIMLLSGKNADLYADSLDTVLNSAGSTARGVEIMNETTSRSFAELGAAWERAKIQIGASLAPAAEGFADALTASIPYVTRFAEVSIDAIGGVIDAISGWADSNDKQLRSIFRGIESIGGDAIKIFQNVGGAIVEMGQSQIGSDLLDLLHILTAFAGLVTTITVALTVPAGWADDIYKFIDNPLGVVGDKGEIDRNTEARRRNIEAIAAQTNAESERINAERKSYAATEISNEQLDRRATMLREEDIALKEAAEAEAMRAYQMGASQETLDALTAAQRAAAEAQSSGTVEYYEAAAAAIVAEQSVTSYTDELDRLRNMQPLGFIGPAIPADIAAGMQAELDAASQSASEFAHWMNTSIPAAGEAALDSIDLVAQGVGLGMVSAEEAVAAFTRNGEVSFQEFYEGTNEILEGLKKNYAEALTMDAGEEKDAALAGYSQQIAVYTGLLDAATDAQNDFNTAGVNAHTVWEVFDQQFAGINGSISEAQSEVQKYEKALKILDDQIAAGIPLSAEQQEQYDNITWAAERGANVIEDDLEPAYVSAANAQAEYTKQMDDLNTALKDGTIDQEQYNEAAWQASQAVAEAVGPTGALTNSQDLLTKSISGLIDRMTGIAIALGLIPAPAEEADTAVGHLQEGFTEFDGSEAHANITVTTDTAEQDLSEVESGFTEFDGGEAQGTLKVDNADALDDTKKASDDAISYAEAEYMAQVEADPTVALREIASAQTDADDFRDGGPYIALLDADDQASGPIDDVGTRIHTLIDGNYTVHIGADISAVYAAVEQANALLPHSPAKEGPLARTPRWDWAFEGAVASAERYVTQAADDAAKFLPFNGRPNRGGLGDPLDWAWLFADIPADAEDYAAQSADAFISFFAGNLSDIANGSAMYDAQKALEESLMIREIAVASGLGADVIEQIDARIQAQRDAIEQIGAVVGSGIVDGLIEEVKQFDIGDALQLPTSGAAWSIDDIVSGDALSSVTDAIADMQSLLAIARETGNEELVALYTAQLAELERQLAVLHEIMGTETVQDLEDTAAATQAAADAAELMKQAFLDVATDPVGAIESAYAAVEQLRAAAHAAAAAGAPASVVQDILSQYKVAYDEATALAQAAAQMFQMGLIDEETLRDMAEAGGDAFVDGFNGAMGDPDAYAGIEATLDAARQLQLAQLSLMIEDAKDGGISLIDELIDGVLSGETKFEDALALFNQIAEQNGQGLQETLGALYLSLQEDLQAALAAGTDTTIIEQNIAIIRQLLASLGLEIDDVLAAANAAAQKASQTNTSSNNQSTGAAFDKAGNPTKWAEGLQGVADDARKLAQIDFPSLWKLFDEMDGGEWEYLPDLFESAAEGAAKYEDVLKTVLDLTAENADEVQDELGDLYESLQDGLAKTLATATDPKQYQASMQNYLTQMDMLKQIVSSMGWQIDDLVKQADEAEERLRAATGGGGAGASLSLTPPTIVNHFSARVQSAPMYLDGVKVAKSVGTRMYRDIPVGTSR